MESTVKKQFRTLGHGLKPVVMIGQSGLTSAVLAEIELALDTHELIKIRIRAEREQRKQISEKICQDTGAEPIQNIGQILLVYRKNPNK